MTNPAGNKRRILIVDDDPDLLQILAIRLRRAGYEISVADSGRAALERIPALLPHVVVTDLRMAEMDGLALFEGIKASHPMLPVIILTAHGTIPDAIDATTRGVFAFLTKPFDAEVLLQHIARAAAIGAASGSDPASIDTAWRSDITTRSPVMDDLLKQAWLAARSDVSIIIQGASGTGKELLAQAMHRASPRAAHGFVAVNCTAIPESLFESEFFGFMKGSFSGATQDRAGLCQAADKGTLLLDEIGDMPLQFQAKLLRVLQEQEVRPVGAQKPVPVDIRVMAATHQNLEEAVIARRFREDLYYRLNVVVLELPSLTRRREDIPLLCQRFVNEANATSGQPPRTFSSDAMTRLIAAPWPGNIRQLHNVVEQCVVLSDTQVIPATLVERALRGRTTKLLPLNEARERFDHQYLIDLLRITDGNVSQAARLAERNRSEFYKLLARHELDPETFRATPRG